MGEVGRIVGCGLGPNGLSVGLGEGRAVGDGEGAVGEGEGLTLGVADGLADGCGVGNAVGKYPKVIVPEFRKV